MVIQMSKHTPKLLCCHCNRRVTKKNSKEIPSSLKERYTTNVEDGRICDWCYRKWRRGTLFHPIISSTQLEQNTTSVDDISEPISSQDRRAQERAREKAIAPRDYQDCPNISSPHLQDDDGDDDDENNLLDWPPHRTLNEAIASIYGQNTRLGRQLRESNSFQTSSSSSIDTASVTHSTTTSSSSASTSSETAERRRPGRPRNSDIPASSDITERRRPGRPRNPQLQAPSDITEQRRPVGRPRNPNLSSDIPQQRRGPGRPRNPDIPAPSNIPQQRQRAGRPPNLQTDSRNLRQRRIFQAEHDSEVAVQEFWLRAGGARFDASEEEILTRIEKETLTTTRLASCLSDYHAVMSNDQTPQTCSSCGMKDYQDLYSIALQSDFLKMFKWSSSNGLCTNPHGNNNSNIRRAISSLQCGLFILQIMSNFDIAQYYPRILLAQC